MKELALEWYAYLSRYDLTTDTSAWHERISDDQAMLRELMANRPHCSAVVLHASWEFLNSHHASFVRQRMREPGLPFEARLADIRARVDEVMAQTAEATPSLAAPGPSG